MMPLSYVGANNAELDCMSLWCIKATCVASTHVLEQVLGAGEATGGFCG